MNAFPLVRVGFMPGGRHLDAHCLHPRVRPLDFNLDGAQSKGEPLFQATLSAVARTAGADARVLRPLALGPGLLLSHDRLHAIDHPRKARCNADRPALLYVDDPALRELLPLASRSRRCSRRTFPITVTCSSVNGGAASRNFWTCSS